MFIQYGMLLVFISASSCIEDTDTTLYWSPLGSTEKYPFQDPSLPWSKRVDDLVQRLDLSEIPQQTNANYGHATPAIPRLGIKPYVWITECLHGHESSNGTAFPQAIGLAASFSPELVSNISEAISTEVRAQFHARERQGIYETKFGLSCFSPVINIMRHPLWGRNQETYGEDPYLSGILGQAFVRGLQGNHPRYVRANAGCKHFDVHGGPENIPTSRFSFDAKVSMRDWRMTFLPQFKACVDAGTYSMMCSYNSVNGIPACANQELLTNITRREWGFKGYIVSDAGAIENIMSYHKYLKTPVEVVSATISAGCNLELGSGSVYNSTQDAIDQGRLTEKQVRDNVKPLMYMRMRLGEFDPPSMNPYAGIQMAVVQSDEHQKLAHTAAMKSFVLLKNEDNTLPLAATFTKAAVVGPFINNIGLVYGSYGPKVMKHYATTPAEGLQRLSQSVVNVTGCSSPHCNDYDSDSIKTAVSDAEAVVICLGLSSGLEEEGHDRKDMDLPGSQLDLLKDAAHYASEDAKVILLLFNAGPLDITWAKLSPRVGAILACFYPAQAAGTALYNVLYATGPDSVPAGRLPATWPAYLQQVPPITNYSMEGHTYRYYRGSPLYPFGYGLSYTTFTYSSLSVSPTQVQAGGNVTVVVSVTNTGQHNADEVVQVYIGWRDAPVPAPQLQLVAFRRTHILVQETQHLTFTITGQQMALWMDDSTGFAVPPGTMDVYAGGQQPNQRTQVPSNVLHSTFDIHA